MTAGDGGVDEFAPGTGAFRAVGRRRRPGQRLDDLVPSRGFQLDPGDDRLSRREYLRRMWAGALLTTGGGSTLGMAVGCARHSGEPVSLFTARHFTNPGSFTRGAEGPAVDRDGYVYAVNLSREGTIGRVTPSGEACVYLELPDGSVGNGIRFGSDGSMFIADYVNHNILRVDPAMRAVRVHAHDPRMNQPNDLAIGENDLLYASDPAWNEGTGQIWRVDPNGRATLLAAGMGTTNGIEVGPDERTLYVNESNQRRVWAFNLSPAGEISGKRLLIEFDADGMDGMRCDVDGRLYITRYGRGTVAIVSPAGELLREVQLAVGRNPTNLAFGGPDGRTVYVTVADEGNLQSFRSDRPGREWLLQRR